MDIRWERTIDSIEANIPGGRTCLFFCKYTDEYRGRERTLLRGCHEKNLVVLEAIESTHRHELKYDVQRERQGPLATYKTNMIFKGKGLFWVHCFERTKKEYTCSPVYHNFKF